MNIITANISDLRNNLSDYLSLVAEGKAVVSVRNAKGGKEVARIISPVSPKTKDEEIEKRIAELKKIAGFAAGYPNENRKRLRRMEIEYTKKLREGKIE